MRMSHKKIRQNLSPRRQKMPAKPRGTKSSHDVDNGSSADRLTAAPNKGPRVRPTDASAAKPAVAV